MPNTTSAKKALRQNKRRHTQNTARQRAFKAAVKEYKKLLAGDRGAAAAKLKEVYGALDKAAKVNVIQPNKAARLKSRLTKKLAAPARAGHQPISESA